MLQHSSVHQHVTVLGSRKLLVELPEDLFKTLKMQSVTQDTTMKALVTDALRQYLAMQEGGDTDSDNVNT
jgi:hypothetical protein